MLKILRVDNRLIHGQVAFSMMSAYKIKKIIVANDRYASNSMLKTTLYIGKPTGVEMSVLTLDETATFMNDSANDLSTTLCVTIDINDAYILSGKTGAIKEVLVGGTIKTDEKLKIYSQAYVSEEDVKKIEEMLDRGINVFFQDIPANAPLSGRNAIKKYNEEKNK